MSKFLGGSAYAMARDIGDGYFAVTERSFKGMSRAEMNELTHEIDRHLRELRGAQSPKDETALIQARSRKIQRLTTAMVILRNYRQKLQL
jgi:hypothetical protein